MNTKRKILALISVASIAILAGCSSTTAGFTIGKNSTSVSEIQKSVDNILAARKGVDTTGMNLQTGSALVNGQVQFMILSQLIVESAKSVGLNVSSNEVAAAKDSAIKQVGGVAAFPKALIAASIDPNSVDYYFTSVIYSQKLSAYVQKNGATAATLNAALTKFVTDYATKVGVKVNPRYGQWDPKTGTLLPADAASGAVKSSK